MGSDAAQEGVHYIKRIGKKKRVKGIHRLFAITYQGIQWAIQGREKEKESFVVVNKKGNPLWRKTSGGKRSKDIPNAWYRLLDRVVKDHPDFPHHGFNTLRDTSADMIRRIAGQEAALIHLTHRHQSSDRNLRRYTNAPRKKVFKAQRILERKLAKAFKSDKDTWKEREHQYLDQSYIKKIQAMSKAGKPVAQIAEEVGVSKSTVYRWADRKRTSKVSSKRKRPTKKTHRRKVRETSE